MQVYNNSNSNGIKTLLLFTAVLFVAYLPASTFMYFIKNDAFNGYFPPRFFISESIRSGYLPLWNPYINYGFPQYGDMSGGFWSPVTWLIASVVGYTAYTFTIEILLYMLLGGVGMNMLTAHFKIPGFVRILAGIAFMCSGFNVGHLQHVNWLSGFAFLTWALWAFLRLYKDPRTLNIVTFTLLLYLFIAAAHPTIIITAFYLFLIIAVFTFFNNETDKGWRNRPGTFLRNIFLSILLLLILSIGLIISYIDILPHFVRGDELNLSQSLDNSVGFISISSYLLPLSSIKNQFLAQTDQSMRNLYIGMLLFIFLVYGIISRKDKWQWLLLITGIIFLLLSTGGIFKTVAHYALPLMSYVRLNGVYLVITTLCFILFSARALSLYFNRDKDQKLLKKITSLLFIVMCCTVAFGFIQIMSTKESLFFSGDYTSAKKIIDGITFYDAIVLQGLIQLIIIVFLNQALASFNKRLLVLICIADVIIASLCNLPYTGVGQASVADVQRVLNNSPKGIPLPAMIPVNRYDTMDTYSNGLTGHWSMYSKQPGVIREVPYPITLKKAHNYLHRLKESGVSGSTDKPLLYFVNDSSLPAEMQVHHFSPTSIIFSINATSNTSVVYQQVAYPYWFYDNGAVLPVNENAEGFISVPLQKGHNKIRIFFDPPYIRQAMLTTLISFIILTLVLLVLHLKSKKITGPSAT